jgi:hypothetical protein
MQRHRLGRAARQQAGSFAFGRADRPEDARRSGPQIAQRRVPRLAQRTTPWTAGIGPASSISLRR